MVCPIRDDAQILRLTIRSIYELHPDEVLFAVDRCSDDTAGVIEQARRLYGHRGTRAIAFTDEDGRGWRFRGAYLRRTLYELARNDIIVNTSADLNLDPKITEIVKQIPPYGLISFGYMDRWTLSTFTGRMHQIIRRDGFGGLLAISRSAWRETEDLEDLKLIPQGEDDHLHRAIMSKYPTCNVVTRSLHLRPNNNAKDDYLCGVDTWKQGRCGLRRVLYRVVRDMRPAFLVGYMHAKRYEARGGDLNTFASRAKETMK